MPEPNIPKQNFITIPNSESRYFCPQERDFSYSVQAGTVLVYLVPWQKGKPGKRVFLLEISQTDKKRTIPALVYEDADYRRWRLLIEPKTDSAVLRVNEFCTEILKQNFLLRRIAPRGLKGAVWMLEFHDWVHQNVRSAPKFGKYQRMLARDGKMLAVSNTGLGIYEVKLTFEYVIEE